MKIRSYAKLMKAEENMIKMGPSCPMTGGGLYSEVSPPKQNDRQTHVKILCSRNFVGGL